MDELRVLQEVKLAVVGAWGEDVGELAVVVVPRELEGSSAVVLLASSGWPGSGGPPTLCVVAALIIGAVAADFLHPVEGLRPEFTLSRVSLARFLPPVGKDCG